MKLAWNYWIMAQYFGAVVWCYCTGLKAAALYWCLALGITATVTFGYQR